MSPRDLIAEGWRITTTQRKLLKWGMVETFILTVHAGIVIPYQTYVLSAYVRDGTVKGIFDVLQELRALLPTAVFILLLVLLGILLLLKITFPTMATGALIGLAAKIHKGEEPKGGLALACFNFMPLLELRATFFILSPFLFVTVSSIMIRYMGGFPTFLSLSPLILILWLASLAIHFLFAFAEEAIVVHKVGVFRAIGKSFRLVISYLTHVLLLAILLFVLTLRVLVNAFVAVLIPALIVGIGLLLTTFLPHSVSFTLSSIVGVTALVFTSYFLGYITILKNTVWTIAYMELAREKPLDLIEEEPAPPPSPPSPPSANEEKDTPPTVEETLLQGGN